jgi:single-strand DNA-binding protein
MTIDIAFYGSVVRDAESKVSKANKPYARFTVRDGDGDAAQFVSVMYFGPDAADLAAKAIKNARIYIEGSLRLDKWEKDGEQRAGLSVMSWHARIAEIGRNRPKRERKSDDKPRATASPARQFNDFQDDPLPF